MENFGPGIIALVGEQAPGIRLRFVQKPNKDSSPLRDGTVDLETGVVGKTTSPEVRVQGLFRDRFIGVVRRGHPYSQGEISTLPLCHWQAHPCFWRRTRPGTHRRSLKTLRGGAGNSSIVGGFFKHLSDLGSQSLQ
ncbi:MAG: hypothetical protein KQI81_09255 [Deltaproteobacteria bacterium]|nr:hypothetical protein [Deltaproteobacteria bacterium]